MELSPRRRTKIVATVGPSSKEPAVLARLLDAGVDVFRLNASHGNHAFFAAMVEQVRRLAAEKRREVAILLDLRGPKLRVGRLKQDAVRLVAGEALILSTEDFEGDAARVPCTYGGLPGDVEEGDLILLDDGLLQLRVMDHLGERELRCRIEIGGTLRSHKGINVPGRALSTPAFDAKDMRDLESAIALEVDFVALSFVRSAKDVRDLRERIHRQGAILPIVAKIEKPQALDGLGEILEASDGIMVARGDLGVELPPERVPEVQKRIIAQANRHGLPVITATQMLESMVEHVRPTRAEASDVANAIFDGTDAVMLSAETAAGRHPVEAVRMMDRIAREAESSEFYGRNAPDESSLLCVEPSLCAMAAAARRVAEEVDARFIVVYTLSGATARVMSKLRPRRSVLALCPDAAICRRMVLEHSIVPLQVDYYNSTDDMLKEGDRLLLETGLVRPGDRVVVLGGTKQFAGVSNMVQLRVVERDRGQAESR